MGEVGQRCIIDSIRVVGRRLSCERSSPPTPVAPLDVCNLHLPFTPLRCTRDNLCSSSLRSSITKRSLVAQTEFYSTR